MRKICSIFIFWTTTCVLAAAQNALVTPRSFAGNFKKSVYNPSLPDIIGRAAPKFFPLAECWENAKNKHRKNTKADFLFVVTTDGLRWQEVFDGADSSLISGIRDKPAAYFSKYFAPTLTERRRRLLPFLWSVFERHGKIFGNRHLWRVNFMGQVMQSCTPQPVGGQG